MLTTIRIRPARSADAGGIAAVHVDTWRSTYPGLVPSSVLVRLSRRAQAREWSAQLSRRQFAEWVVVAELDNGRIIGFGSCGEARATGLPQAGEIFTLYVSPEHQDCGVGRAIMLRLFDLLNDRGLTSVLVWVLAQNPSRFFYEAMGGRRVAEREERLWNTMLAQTAYGWDDLRLVTAQRGLREP